MKLLAVVCFFIAARAQDPKRCGLSFYIPVAPRQWEAGIFRSVRGVDNVDEEVTITYDEINRRIRELETITLPTEKQYVEVIYLFDLGRRYRINQTTKQCNVTAITSTFTAYAIPLGATFDGYATIGAAGVPGEFRNVETWSFLFGPSQLHGVVTTPSCIPVHYTEYTPPSIFITAT